MNIAPVSIRTLLMALIRPMPIKAPRQEASATASSERAEPCGGREGERDINYVSYSLPCAPQPSCPSPVCSGVDEPVMRIDLSEVDDVLARVDQRIMAARQPLHQLLKLLQLVAVGGQQVVELKLVAALELLHEVRDHVDRIALP